MTPATTSRLLTTLLVSGILDQVDDGGRYFIGPRLIGIAQAYLDSVNLNSVSEKYLRELVDVTGETVFLGVLDKVSVVIINCFDSPQPLRMAADLGTREPACRTALGKVLLSDLPEPVLRERLDLFDFGSAPATAAKNADELRILLDETRTRGWALDNEEHIAGVRCVACGIRDGGGKMVSAISVSGPATRLTEDRIEAIVPALRTAAAGISGRLGYEPDGSETAFLSEPTCV